MTLTSIHRRTCRLCDSPRVELAVPIKASPVADAYVDAEHIRERQELFPLDLYLCRECGHVQLLDIVDPAILFGSYIYATSISLGLVEHFRVSVDSIMRRYPARAGSLAVDIGSNDGTVLRLFQALGLRVLGIDPASEIALKATASGVETLPSFFTSKLAREIAARHGRAAMITANNVFAHSDSLADMADGIRGLLADDGVFVFEVSYLADIVDKLLFDTVYHEHLCYHSIKPFVQFFHRHGLELVDVERLPTKGGSIRGYVQLRGAGRAVAPVVGELMAEETARGLDQPPLFQRYTYKIESIKQELLAFLKAQKAAGKRIAGFGASATVTTLIYNFELAPYLDFLVDDNQSRHGLFSPGCHLPVLSPDTLLERRPDFVVVLAWQYAAPILKKHARYREQGGVFVLPLPELKVV